MSNIKTADLENRASYKLLEELSHQDLIPFIQKYYWRERSWVLIVHYLFTLGCLAAWLAIGWRSGQEFSRWLDTFGFAVLAFIVLVPVHEAIHGIVYKLYGAPDVRISVSFRKLYAYAIADKFVVSGRAFALVAVMPFLIINGGLIGVGLFSETYRFFAICLLLVHTGGTSGDWAMLNYLWLNRERKIYTFDDAARSKSYFYERI